MCECVRCGLPLWRIRSTDGLFSAYWIWYVSRATIQLHRHQMTLYIKHGCNVMCVLCCHFGWPRCRSLPKSIVFRFVWEHKHVFTKFSKLIGAFWFWIAKFLFLFRIHINVLGLTDSNLLHWFDSKLKFILFKIQFHVSNKYL